MKLTGGVPEQYNLDEMLFAYRKGEMSKTQIKQFNDDMLNPYLEGMLKDFQGATFVDRVRADADSVLDILSKSVDVSLITQGLLPKKNITNTPLLTINTHADPLVPAIESQMATDASVQGKQMIYSGYGGHCVDRAAMPTVIEWLAYHLKLDVLGTVVNENRARD